MTMPQVPKSSVPEWARKAVFYHIYPLGFLGTPAQNPGEGDPVPRLADLRRWYDHISDLGVTAIYFGPLFESHSHGYDTIDYFRIDRRLGDSGLFREIVDELHARDIRVILDGVFNHTGRGFFAFEDIRQKGRESTYQSWYHINWGADSPYNDGFTYESWDGHPQLPKLNLENPDTRNYVFEVARMWLGDIGVDGWRLDVAYEIEPQFWWNFRRVCREANPEAFLLGEIIHGDYRRWVAPDFLDSATNYQQYKASWSAFNDVNFHELKHAVERSAHPEWGLYKDIHLVNFLGNHDVTRILSQLDNPAHIYPALIYLLTTPDIPCLYYGDEVGMTGHKDDGDRSIRQPMPAPDDQWPDADRSIYRVTARLASLRHTHPALIYGRYASLETTATQYSYLRQHHRESAVIILSSAETPGHAILSVGREGVPDGTEFVDVLDDLQPRYTVKEGRLLIDSVPANWGRVLIAQH